MEDQVQSGEVRGKGVTRYVKKRVEDELREQVEKQQ
jgi:hypothetical protein